MSTPDFKLYTYPPEIKTEHLRWLFTHYGVAFEERRATLAPPLLWMMLWNYPRFRSWPPFARSPQSKLYFHEPQDVVRHFDPLSPDERRLGVDLAQQPASERELLEQSMKIIDRHVRAWAYSHITPNKDSFLHSVSVGAPGRQKRFVRMSYPLIASLAERSLAPQSAKTQERYALMLQAFEQMDALLADGRTFLCGERLSVLDILFCGLAAPCVMTPHYGGGGIFPVFEQLPESMQPLVQAFRERPTGQYVMNLYAAHRQAPPGQIALD